MNLNLEAFSSHRLLILGSVFLGILFFEQFFSLRKAKESKFRRLAVNLSLAALGGILVRFITLPFTLLVSQFTLGHGLGLITKLNLSRIPRVLLLLVLLDSTLYIWHRMNHESSFLWRFHNVHHVDLDMDVSTASRFHFGELFFSAIYRGIQIVVLGVDPTTLIFYETLTTGFALFHHSNLRLPVRFEKLLQWVLVTPRMHGIHHSIVRTETDSNYSTIFSIWDRVSRSLVLDIPQSEINIGVPSYRKISELSLWKCILLPFTRPRRWQLPDGEVPNRLNFIPRTRL